VTVFASAVESVEDGVTLEYDRLWNRYVDAVMTNATSVRTSQDLENLDDEMDKPVAPKEADYPAVIVKLTSGRKFRIVGKTRKEVEQDILWAKRRDRS